MVWTGGPNRFLLHLEDPIATEAGVDRDLLEAGARREEPSFDLATLATLRIALIATGNVDAFGAITRRPLLFLGDSLCSTNRTDRRQFREHECDRREADATG